MRRLPAVSVAIGTILVLGACSSGAGNTSSPAKSAQPTRTTMEYSDEITYELNEAGFKKDGGAINGFYGDRDLAQNWVTTAGGERIELMILDNGWGDGAFVERLTYTEDFTVPEKGTFSSFRCTQQALKGAHSPETLMLITEALRSRLVAGDVQLKYSKTRKVDVLDRKSTVGITCFAFNGK